MKMKEDIKPVTYMKTHSSDLINTVSKNKRPVVITQKGEAKAVLMDVESYEKQKETLLMLKVVAEGEKDIKKGRVIEQDKLFSEIERKFGLKK